MATQRNYREEYDKYQGTPEQKKNRAARNKARRQLTKELGKTALKGKDVDHKVPLKDGGSTKRSNLRVLSVHVNRGRNN